MLPILILAYNDSYHSALGVSPSVVFLGRKLGSQPLTHPIPEGDYTQLGFAAKLDYILAKTHSLVFAKIQEKLKANQLKSQSLAGGREPTIFTLGQEVLLFRPVMNSESSFKLTPHWFGPYKVERVGRHNKVYYLKDPTGNSLKFPVSIWRLKAYNARDENEPVFEKFPEEVTTLAESSVENSLETISPKDSASSQDSQDTPIFNLEWNNPEEEFVPLKNTENVEDQEEVEVLQSLQTPTLLRSRHLARMSKTPVKFSIPSKLSTISGGKKRKGRMYQ